MKSAYDDPPNPAEPMARCVLGSDAWHAVADPNRIDIDAVKIACGGYVMNASKIDTLAPTCPACRNVVRGWVRRGVARPGANGGGV